MLPAASKSARTDELNDQLVQQAGELVIYKWRHLHSIPA